MCLSEFANSLHLLDTPNASLLPDSRFFYRNACVYAGLATGGQRILASRLPSRLPSRSWYGARKAEMLNRLIFAPKTCKPQFYFVSLQSKYENRCYGTYHSIH